MYIIYFRQHNPHNKTHRLWLRLVFVSPREAVAPTPWGTGARAPHFYKWLGTMGTVSRRTANKKLTKLYWPSLKRSPKRLIVLLEPKSGGSRPTFFFGSVPPPPTFKFVPVPLTWGAPLWKKLRFIILGKIAYISGVNSWKPANFMLFWNERVWGGGYFLNHVSPLR